MLRPRPGQVAAEQPSSRAATVVPEGGTGRESACPNPRRTRCSQHLSLPSASSAPCSAGRSGGRVPLASPAPPVGPSSTAPSSAASGLCCACARVRAQCTGVSSRSRHAQGLAELALAGSPRPCSPQGPFARAVPASSTLSASTEPSTNHRREEESATAATIAPALAIRAGATLISSVVSRSVIPTQSWAGNSRRWLPDPRETVLRRRASSRAGYP